MYQRMSKSEIKKDSWKVDENDGSIIFETRIAKTGILDYYEYDYEINGFKTIKEVNLPQDLFSMETMESAKNKLVTNEHPFDLVSSDNATTEFKGFSLNDVKNDGKYLTVSIKVFDKELQADILSGNKSEISVGKTVKLLDEQGEFEGEKYDKRQADIRINHIAIVQKGRAGSEVKVLKDSNNIRFDYKPTLHTNQITKEETMEKKIDNADFEALQKTNSELQAKIDELEKEKEELTSKNEKQDGALEQLQEQVNELSSKMDNAISKDEVISKLNLIREVEEMTNKRVDSSLNERDLMLEVISMSNKADFTNKSDEYVKGAYEVAKGTFGTSIKTDSKEGKLDGKDVKIDTNGKTLAQIREELKK